LAAAKGAFKFKFQFKTVGSPPTRAQRRFKRTSFGILRFFNCALSLNRDGRVSGISVTAAKCRRLGGTFAAGFEPMVSNRLLSVIFECGPNILKVNTTLVLNLNLNLNLKNLRPRSKRRRGRGAKPRGVLRGLKPELRLPRSGGVCGYNGNT